MINPIDLLAPMLRDLAAQNGLEVDEAGIAEARAYCDEEVPIPHVKAWPKCRCCGEDLMLSNVRLGFCNVECRDKYEDKRT